MADEMVDPHAEFRMPTFIRRCMEEDPRTWWLTTISGSAALMMTLYLCFSHSKLLSTRPLCLQRGYYRGMLYFPMVWAISNWCNLFCPLGRPLNELFSGQSEAYAIYLFLVILFMLVSIEARRRRPQSATGATETEEASTGDLSNMGLAVIQAVQDYGPQKYFAVPPLCCLFSRCLEAHHISAKQLLWVSRLVKQYGALQIFFNSYFLWARLTLRPKEAERVQHMAEAVLKISGMLAMYGLFIMYQATHDLLHEWNTTRKFVALKLIILVSTVQGMVISWISASTPLLRASCLISQEHPENMYRLCTFWGCYFTLLETVVLSYLIIQAFPAEEVSDYPLKNLDLVELELRQIHAQDSRRSA